MDREMLAKFASALNKVNLASPGDRISDTEQQTIRQDLGRVYDVLAEEARTGEIWNWGMCNPNVHREIDARIKDYDKFNTDGYSEQLYFFTLNEIPIADLSSKKVLEVGCGMGEGLNFLSRIHSRTMFTGVDLSGHAITRANARLGRAGLTFVQGDAQNLPFKDAEFDGIINIESSHNYPDIGKFYSEVARVLKPGGFFSYVDLFTKEHLERMRRHKAEQSGLTWLKEQDISEYVKASVRNRMNPDSYLRKRLRDKGPKSPIANIAAESFGMAAYGATFIDYPFGAFRNALRWALKPPGSDVAVDSYRHSLAKKD